MEKHVALFLSLLIVLCAIPLSVYAADSDAITAADALYELGLFKGTGTDSSGDDSLKPTSMSDGLSIEAATS